MNCYAGKSQYEITAKVRAYAYAKTEYVRISTYSSENSMRIGYYRLLEL